MKPASRATVRQVALGLPRRRATILHRRQPPGRASTPARAAANHAGTTERLPSHPASNHAHSATADSARHRSPTTRTCSRSRPRGTRAPRADPLPSLATSPRLSASPSPRAVQRPKWLEAILLQYYPYYPQLDVPHQTCVPTRFPEAAFVVSYAGSSKAIPIDSSCSRRRRPQPEQRTVWRSVGRGTPETLPAITPTRRQPTPPGIDPPQLRHVHDHGFKARERRAPVNLLHRPSPSTTYRQNLAARKHNR